MSLSIALKIFSFCSKRTLQMMILIPFCVQYFVAIIMYVWIASNCICFLVDLTGTLLLIPPLTPLLLLLFMVFFIQSYCNLQVHIFKWTVKRFAVLTFTFLHTFNSWNVDQQWIGCVSSKSFWSKGIRMETKSYS